MGVDATGLNVRHDGSMAKRKLLRRRLNIRISIQDQEDLEAWAVAEGSSVGNYVRDMVRRERERLAWAQRDKMAAREAAREERAS